MKTVTELLSKSLNHEDANTILQLYLFIWYVTRFSITLLRKLSISSSANLICNGSNVDLLGVTPDFFSSPWIFVVCFVCPSSAFALRAHSRASKRWLFHWQCPFYSTRNEQRWRKRGHDHHIDELVSAIRIGLRCVDAF